VHEADRIWSRFTVYLTLNSAVLAFMALSVKDLVTGLGGYSFSVRVALAGSSLGLVGLWLSYCWLRTTRAGDNWQRLLIDHLSALEEHIPSANLWATIKAEGEKNGHISIMRTAQWVNYCFIAIWLIVLVICAWRILHALALVDDVARQSTVALLA